MPFGLTSEAIIAYVQANLHLVPHIVFLMALAETIVGLSVVVPSTFLLFAVGGLMAANGVPLIPSLIAGWMGASLGFSIMYLVSAILEGSILSYWPFRNYSGTIATASAFSRRWGVWGVVIGHFGGPIRVVIPIVAGISRMPPVPFMLANLVGALGWIITFLAPGYLLVNSDTVKATFSSLKALF